MKRSIDVTDSPTELRTDDGAEDIDYDLHPWAGQLPIDENGFTGNAHFGFDASRLTEEDAVLQII